MFLDTKNLRYLSPDDWRVLTAVEMGSKNHEIVPTSLIEKIAHIHGNISRNISTLAKTKLIARIKEARYDGYRLTYGGLDYLAMHTYVKRDAIFSVGSRIGVGKESDIMVVADKTGKQLVLKIHRLGRISFRTVKNNRDYLRKRQARGAWMYLSRLSAMREYAFLEALYNEGFPVPQPLTQARHTILMTYVENSLPLRQISSVPDPAKLYAELIALILRLAKHGLIHGDFNEFNILIQEQEVPREQKPETETEDTSTPRNNNNNDDDDDNDDVDIKLVPVLIDFPQMVSMEHKNAEMYFNRDVACVKRFFEKRFRFVSSRPGPFFKDAKATVGRDGATRIDAAVEASGFTKKMAKELEAAILEQAAAPDDYDEEEDEEDDDEEESEEEDDEEEEEGEDGNDVEQKSVPVKAATSPKGDDAVQEIEAQMPALKVG